MVVVVVRPCVHFVHFRQGKQFLVTIDVMYIIKSVYDAPCDSPYDVLEDSSIHCMHQVCVMQWACACKICVLGLFVSRDLTHTQVKIVLEAAHEKEMS